VIAAGADLAAEQVANEQTSALIHGLGADTAAGVAVGGAEGLLLTLDNAAVTTNQVLNENAVIPDSPKQYTDANGNALSEEQIDAILATAGITEAAQEPAPQLVTVEPAPAVVQPAAAVEQPAAAAAIETIPQSATPEVPQIVTVQP